MIKKLERESLMHDDIIDKLNEIVDAINDIRPVELIPCRNCGDGCVEYDETLGSCDCKPCKGTGYVKKSDILERLERDDKEA